MTKNEENRSFFSKLKKNALKTALSLSLAGIVTLGAALSAPMNSYAALLFSDVEANHWAISAIKTMSEKNIMPGYSDATFKPLQQVTKVELVTLSYRMLKESGKLGTFNAADSVNRNKEALSSAKIPALLAPYSSDVYTAFGFALDKGIITKEELSTYLSSGTLVNATKEQVATIIGKTINYAKPQNLTGKIISFSFNDASQINSLSAPYINLLIDYKLIGSAGDASGNFNPRASLGRDVVANMANGAYNIINGSTTGTTTGTSSTGTTTGTTTTGTTTTTTGTTTGTTTTSTSTTSGLQNASISGTITNIVTDKLSIEVKDSLGKTAVYSLSGTEIIKNNTVIGFLNLSSGENVILNLVNGKVTKMVVEKNYSKAEGSFVELSKPVTDSATNKVFRVITIKKADGKLDYYKIETGLYVEIDRVVKTVEDLAKGDKMTISYDGYFARKIDAYTAKSEVLITLVKVTDFKANSSMTYKLQDGRAFEYQLKADAEVVKIANKDLKKGDIVKATYVYGELKKLEATGLVSEDAGAIKEILISDGTSKITILNAQNERKTYGLQGKVVMTIGDMKTNVDGLYSLRIGQNVSLEMDALGIYNLTVAKASEKTKLSLTLMEVVKGTNLIKATDSEGKVWVINLKEGAAVIDNFVPGDKIEVTGLKLSDLIFEAELMTKVN